MIARQILRAAMSSGATRVISLSINLFLTSFMLRTLGDTQYGLFVLVNSFATQGAILDLGIGPAVIKYVAEAQARREFDYGRSVIATALSLYCLLGLIALLLAGVIAPFFPHFFNVPPPFRTPTAIAVLLVGVQVAISIPLATPGAILWGIHRYEQCQAVGILLILLSAGSTVAVLLAGGGIVGLFAIGIPALAAPLLLMIWLARRFAPQFRMGLRGFNRDLVGKLLSYSIPTFVMQVAYNLQTQIDEIVVGLFLPISSVGAYYIARRLSTLPQMLSQPLLGAFLPIASQLDGEGNVERLRLLYLVGSRLILAICLPLLCVVIVLAGPLLTLWVGAKYADNAPIVVILALASVLEVGYWPGRSILQGLARHHRLAAASVCAAVANLGLSIFLVRYYGTTGVALGTLIPAAVVNVGYIWPHTMKTIAVSSRELVKHTLLPAFVPTLPTIAVLYGIVLMAGPSGIISVLATAVAGVATYAVVYMIFFAGDQERELLRNVFLRLSTTLTPRPDQL